ncbi:MAG TPA: nickel pincer cofactor biosynthesis protein LarC [Methanoregulaceae archaeon]|nr:MAG: nickel pincer cofactor biosynthesis protein LarC [Methanolinea sp.]HON80668.1 nickel pincer cofactor biosynthesis protein LarC [Methanoregulaceae archaeon]HPD09402.1 nickel pincer cofactor biosynthesis protein LarC [Methanoregulaceae archaeon]HRT14805.1 nickel pincer cofactor biosynthesis protein LarC [Methanoregulaceae archaeon]HRU30378.1 nickel pincer cofactor biosynthesis protein LarC [Methanoregulaceae archaeon]
MRLLVFDPFHGAAGDMITAALLHLGADRKTVISAMASVVEEPEVTMVDRSGIRAFFLRTHAGPAKRTFDEVAARVKSAHAPDKAISLAIRVFERIDRAEREIHGGATHFHEVGADDAIADVIGACTAYVSLAPEGCVVLPVALGGGRISGAHGTYPVPAPATLAILRESGLPVSLGSAESGELCTPTGAALLSEFSTIPDLKGLRFFVRAIGYGAGSRDPPGIPNVLRAMVVESTESADQGGIDLLETNVDDVSAEIIAHATALLMDEGAYDVSVYPCTMKKGRPGHLVRVIAPAGCGERLASVMAMELGTLGIRCIPVVHRFTAERVVREVPVTILGKERTVRVKYGMLAGEIFSLKAEYEDTAAISRETGLPVRTVARIIESRAWELAGNPDR